MAILKDLIVHGSSRFLNKIYASEIQTPLIEAEAGIFKKLKADDATVVGLLDVQGELHTNSWTNSNIATIDGSFYITPTLSSSSGTVSFSDAETATFTGSYAAVSSLYVGNNTASTVQWTSGSKILITGQVQVDGEWIPLGTLLGILNSTNPTTSMPIVSITDNRNNPSTILADIYSLKNNTSLSYRNLKVSLYQRADNQEYYPLGIFMTALGQNGKTFLDIYGGVNSTETASYEDSNNNIISNGGYADPNVRIGNLSGLAPITTAAGNFTPVGWGIYTTNGYFSGTIVSNTGVIGGWKLGANSLYNGTTGLNNTTAGIYLGTDGIRNYKDTDTYVNITEGVITAKGVNLTGQINATAGNIGGATIEGGTLTVPAAYINGELTAATINGSKITANSITAGQIAASAITADELAANAVTSTKIKAGEVKANNIAANAVTAGKINVDSLSAITANLGTITTGVIKHDTVGGTDGIWLSADTDTSSNITVGESTARKDWRLLVNNKFGVTKTGDLYASSANISGKITATSGIIGGIQLDTNGKMWITDANISGTISGNHIDASSISIGSLNGASNYAQKTDLEKVGEIVTYYLLSEKSEGVSFEEDTGWTLTPGIVTEEKKYLWAYQITKYGTNDENYEITEKAKIVSFYNEKQPIPLKNLVVDIDPVQSGSGDPSPNNIRSITGFDVIKLTRTGKNLFVGFSDSTKTISGVTVVFSDGAHVNISGTTSVANVDTSIEGNGGTARHHIIFEKGKTYIASLSGTFSLTGSGDSVRLMLENDSEVVWHAVSTTGVWEIIPEEDFIVDRLRFRIPTKGTVVNIDADFQIEVGPEATEFESYNGNIYEVSLSQAGTVYGGTFNVLTGKLIIDRYVEDLSQKTWTTRYTGTLHKTLSTSLNNTYPRAEAQEKIIAEYYTVRPISGAAKLETPDDDEVGIYWYDNNANLTPSTLYIVIDINTTPSGSIVYPLVEPIEYQLTPLEVRSLTKANNIWADTGEVEVTYSTNAIKTEPYIVGTYDNTEIINNISTTANKALNQSSWYATCSTPGGTTEKIATITPATTAFTLTEGATVNVKFDVKNTSAVGSITLNVNETGAKNIKYINNNAISNIPGTDYIAAGRTYQFVYDGTYWVIQNLNYNTNTNTIGTLGATKLIAGTNANNASATTVYRYTLIMKKTIGNNPTWVSLVTSSTTGTSKTRYTEGLYPDKIFYMNSNVSSSPYGYNTGASIGDSYAALGFDLRYSTNCGSTLTIGKPVYLVGEINPLDGLFYLDSTWWTQTEPTTEDGKTYIYLGNAYSATNVYLVEKNPLMRYYRGAFRTEEQIAGMTATSYITYIDANNGIKIHDYNNVTDYLQINSDAISMYRANEETLRIEDNSIRIGNINYQNLLLESNQISIRKGNKESLKIKTDEFSYFFKSGISPFHIKQLGHIETQTGDGTKKQFTSNSSYFISQLLGVTINSIEQEENDDYTYSIQDGVCTVTFVSTPANNSTINFNYDIEYQISQLSKVANDTDPYSRKHINLSQNCIDVLHVYINDAETTAWSFPSFPGESGETITLHDYITLSNDPGQGANIKVVYKIQPEGGFYTTLGTRATGQNSPGPYSIVIGEENFATGRGAFAAGRNVNVSGEYSFAYGDGGFSDSDAIEVTSNYAGAIGKGLRVSRTGGFACGTYNTWSPSYSWAFQVGNGTGPMDRSDAFGVATNGNVYIAGKLLSGVVGKNPHYLFTTEDFEVDNISVPATGGSVAAISETKIVNVAINGYIAIGLMSFVSQTATNKGLNASCVFPYAWWLNQNYFRFSLRNTIASPAKCKIHFRILYIAADAINTSLFPSSGNV